MPTAARHVPALPLRSRAGPPVLETTVLTHPYFSANAAASFSVMRVQRRDGQRPDPWSLPDPLLGVALEQLDWYAVHRARARWGHYVLEVLQILGAAGATLAAGLQAAAWATAVLAAATLVVTGLRQVFHLHENWLAFAVAWAQLNTAINEYRMLPEGDARVQAGRALVDRVNSVVEGETRSWAARQTKDRDAGQRSGVRDRHSPGQ